MNFQDGEEFYEYLDTASPEELMNLVSEHEKCFTTEICELETRLFEDDELEDLIALEVAKAPEVTPEILEYILNLDSGGDGGRYEQARWAVIESPELTVELLRKVDPYTIAMAYQITIHPISDGKIVKSIFEDWYDQEIITSYLKQDLGFSTSEVLGYETTIERKLNQN